MARITRRKVLKASGVGGMAGILASGQAPAYAQGSTLHWLGVSLRMLYLIFIRLLSWLMPLTRAGHRPVPGVGCPLGGCAAAISRAGRMRSIAC